MTPHIFQEYETANADLQIPKSLPMMLQGIFRFAIIPTVIKKIIAEILNIKPSLIKARDNYVSELTSWLTDSKVTKKPENPIGNFLSALNSFDLNEYIKAIRFDELKVPSLPFQLPTAKSYYGINEMKTASLIF